MPFQKEESSFSSSRRPKLKIAYNAHIVRMDHLGDREEEEVEPGNSHRKLVTSPTP